MTHLIKKLKVLSDTSRIEDAIRFRLKSNEKNVFITKLLLFPYILLWGGKIVYSKVSRLRHQNENDKTKGIAIVAICKNESPYILEWIAFHKIIGIDHIFIYNNGSTDDTVEKIRKIFHKDFVSIIDFPGEKKQFPAYNDALLRFGKNFRYMAFIDCDEFIMPKVKGMNIEKYLDTLTKNNAEAGSICINWCMYGSSGLLHKTNDLILEKFLNRGDQSTR